VFDLSISAETPIPNLGTTLGLPSRTIVSRERLSANLGKMTRLLVPARIYRVCFMVLGPDIPPYDTSALRDSDNRG